jgi:hypothetical protein
MAKSPRRGYVVSGPVTMKRAMVARLKEELQREKQRISESQKRTKEIQASLEKLREDRSR